MSRTQLRIAAVVLSVAIVVVAANALDHLPGSMRAQIDGERDRARERAVAAWRRAGPGGRPSSGESPICSTLCRSAGNGPTVSARRRVNFAPPPTTWTSLRASKNTIGARTGSRWRRCSRDEKKFRAQALADAGGIQKDAAHWVDASNHLPDQIPEMERNYQAIHGFDLGPATAAVERAGADWPEKKSDLDARLASERAMVTQADAQWQATAEARRKAAAGNLAGADAAALLGFEASLETSAADLPKKAEQYVGRQ